MADAQPGMGKGNACHGGGKVHPQAHLLLSGIGGREHRIGHAEALPCVHIGKHPGVGGRVGFQPVRQHVKSRIRNQPRGQLFEQVAVQNCRTGAQPFVNQGVLCLSMGQDGEVRHLRPRAGGGGNGHQRKAPLGKIGHCLGAVHGAAAPQSNQQIRLELLELRRPLRRQRNRWIRLHGVKVLDFRCTGQPRNAFRRPVFHEVGIRHQQQALCTECFQRRNGTCPGIDSCF